MIALDGGPNRYGPNTAVIDDLLSTARHLSRQDLGALGAIEHEHADVLLAAWDSLRDRLGVAPYRTWRFAARDSAWHAIQAAGRRASIRIPSDTGYWRVDQAFGCGAARAARFAACALVAPELLDEEYFEVLLMPWRAVVADPRPAGPA